MTSARARRTSGAMTRIVSSPAMRADHLRQPRAVERDAEQLRLPRPGAQQHHLLHAVDARQVFAERALQQRAGGLAVGRDLRGA